MTQLTALMSAIAFLSCAGAQAQTTGSEVQRNIDQQQRIEQGLQSGQLTTREAASLEGGAARIDRLEAHAQKDGVLTPAEKTRIRNAQNAESRAIYRQKHDAQVGNPASVSSQRMQADVQRNVDQQARIERGVASGDLTNREVAGLERGQARVSRKEADAGADGHVGPVEQAKVQRAENVQSARIHERKHDGKVKPAP